MAGWIGRLILFLAGLVTGLFVSQDALNYGFIQMVIAVLLFTCLIGFLALWPFLRRWIHDRWTK